MKNNTMLQTQRKMALVTGFSLIAMALLAGFAYGYGFEAIYVTSDRTATLLNLNNSKLLFRWVIFSFVIILILDVVVDWALYIFFKQVNESLFVRLYCLKTFATWAQHCKCKGQYSWSVKLVAKNFLGDGRLYNQYRIADCFYCIHIFSETGRRSFQYCCNSRNHLNRFNVSCKLYDRLRFQMALIYFFTPVGN